MNAEREVIMFPATLTNTVSFQNPIIRKRRVAAYARVSTELEEQQTSFEAQVSYYTDYINKNKDWTMVRIYTDEGISATNTKHRDGFNEMITDALDGKIDLIVTKSVSRFARNTVDSLVTVRKLKEKGVEVYFEKENIFTLDSKGELLITIMSSLAQEESRSISENVTWGQRKRMADGKITLPYKHFLGYEKGEDGIPQINEDEAVTVRLIYLLFLEGGTPHGIAKQLTDESIPTPSGKRKWQSGTVRSILSNEKYKGDALLQKKYTVDFLTKKQKVNEGEIPQYYVKNSHPAIISPDVFDIVQQEIKNRLNAPARHSGTGIFASRIICGCCGAYYGSKVWHSNDRYRRVIYQCNNKFKNGKKCTTPHFDEDTIKRLFVSAVNKLIVNKKAVFKNIENMKQTLWDNTALDIEYSELQNEMTVSAKLVQKCVEENAHVKLDQTTYLKQYEALTARFEAVKTRFGEITELRQQNKVRCNMVNTFVKTLQAQDELITEFDTQLWHTLVDCVTVYSEKDVLFTFRNGTIINA